MKKTLFIGLFSIVLAGGVLTSCSNDDDSSVVSPITQTKTYADASGLTLTYSGAPMLGKQVVFTPDANDITKATLTLSGAQTTSPLSDNASGLATAGVIPGEVSTTIDVDLTIKNDTVTFAGEENRGGYTLKYQGSATDASLNLALNVTFVETAWTNTSWQLLPASESPFSGDPMQPIHVVWDAEPFDFMGSPNEIQSLITLVISMTQIEGNTIPKMLCEVLNKVTFLSDGNVQAEYKDSLNATEWKTSPLNLATYTVPEPNKIRLFLNPAQIAATASGKSRAGMTDVLSQLMAAVTPMLSEGILITLEKDEEGVLKAYLDTETLLPILKIVAPLFEDEAAVEQILSMLKAQAGEMAGMVDVFLKPILVAMPQIIGSTETIQIGIKMQAAQ